ncbi:MAG TPA: glycosyltransferase family 4 protein, partial [Treponemataceae bacterium]|nr:glycosyltransferase family 4 protein [Treponemataceae bacterium]
MTILGIFINNEIRTGANRRYLELMEGLAERGNTVRVLMNTHLDYKPVHFERIAIPVDYTRKKFPPASLLLFFKLRDMKREILKKVAGTEWIHIHSDMNLSAALYLKKRTRAKLFYAVRCNDITRARILMKQGGYSVSEKIASLVYIQKKKSREKKIARHAERITFMNHDDRNHFISRTHVAEQKTSVIPGNIGLPRFTEEWKEKNASNRVQKLVYAGALSASKGFYLLLDLLLELRKRGYPYIKLYALGRTAGKNDLFAHIKDLGLGDQIIFTGYVNPFSHFAESDLFVYPTLYDAWGDVVMEAMYTGCPAIASAVGGLPDLLKYPELLFESGNVTQMADMVERAITDPEYYQQLRNLCASRVPELTFDWVERFEAEMKGTQGER